MTIVNLLPYVLEICAAPAIGNFTTGSPVAGWRPWSSYALNAIVFYTADDTFGNVEEGIGTVTAGHVSRDTVLWNSAGTQPAKLNFSNAVRLFSVVPPSRQVYRDDAGNLTTAYDISSPTQNGGQLAGFRNRLINSALTFNQRAYVGGTAIVAAKYMHDRWKAGAGGCTYTFTGTPWATITITAGTLQQVVPAASMEGGTYTLSWTGTAQGRVDAGVYAASPLTVTALSAGANHTVEFNAGTLSKPQFEPGLIPSQYEVRFSATEQQLCDRHFVAGIFNCTGYAGAGQQVAWNLEMPTAMNATPTLAITGATNVNSGTNTLTSLTTRNMRLVTTVTALGLFTFNGNYTAEAEL